MQLVTVVLMRQIKDFVYVAGSFNWQPTNSYAMKRSCFWKILVGIKWFGIGCKYSYQYWVGNNTLVNSPALVKLPIRILL
jgi:hypothetical protein